MHNSREEHPHTPPTTSKKDSTHDGTARACAYPSSHPCIRRAGPPPPLSAFKSSRTHFYFIILKIMVAFNSFILLVVATSVSCFSLARPSSRSLSNNLSTAKPIRNDYNGNYCLKITAESHSSVTVAAIKAVAKLLSTCGIGVLATRKGLLDKTAVDVLSKLVFNLFQPCLLFVNIVSTISSGVGGHAAIILPLAASFQIFVAYGIGKFLSYILYGVTPSDSAKQLLTCATFGNSGLLSILFPSGVILCLTYFIKGLFLWYSRMPYFDFIPIKHYYLNQ